MMFGDPLFECYEGLDPEHCRTRERLPLAEWIAIQDALFHRYMDAGSPDEMESVRSIWRGFAQWFTYDELPA